MYCINKVNFQNFATENFSFSINRVIIADNNSETALL